MIEGSWTIRSCPPEEARRLAEALGVSATTASVLVRRGYAEPAVAQAFLDGALPGHDSFSLGQMAEAVDAIRAAIAGGKRICVHGDYDVDGICATALGVLVLRELGADVVWHLPSRFDEGYGLNGQTLARLADDGVDVVLTVDCGITAVDEVAEGKRLGLEVVVTDHHRPGDTLPDCPVVATLVGSGVGSTEPPSSGGAGSAGAGAGMYAFSGLCGTGVVYKLAKALESEEVDRHLDLVALATIADVVPLLDENRGLAIAGLRALARTQKPGLQALMRHAGVDPAAVDEGAVGFRLAPRINAAGRLCRPQSALELLLTGDKEEAHRLAGELETLNRERQAVEERIMREAAKQIESWPDAARRRRAWVLANEDWHEGVIGIVASRLVERYGRPVVLIAGTEQAREGSVALWKGSGRSIASFDLHAGLGACAAELERFGGHRAAAGLSIEPARVEAFAEAFAAHAEAVLGDEDLRQRIPVDAVVQGRSLTLDLCGELQQLAPFGLGNPGVTLLLPGCEVGGLDTVGEGKHLRFRVRDGGLDAGSAIAFGMGSHLDRLRQLGHYDVVFRLQENRWNGTVSPQLVVRRVLDAPEGYHDLRDRFASEFRAGSAAWTADARAIFAELGLDGERPQWRSLLESARFRELLLEPGLAVAA
jgi:single-stranded-DNA-specific exonuclease